MPFIQSLMETREVLGQSSLEGLLKRGLAVIRIGATAGHCIKANVIERLGWHIVRGA